MRAAISDIDNNLQKIFYWNKKYFRILVGRRAELYSDPNASEEGQADVLLGAVPLLRHPQDVLPRHQVQQEQHRPARQVVLQLQVILFWKIENDIFAQRTWEPDNWRLISIGPIKCLDGPEFHIQHLDISLTALTTRPIPSFAFRFRDVCRSILC